MLRSLGLELGLGRVKLVAIEAGWQGVCVRTSVRAVPVLEGEDQADRLERGAAIATGRFLGELGWEEADRTVVASTAAMAHPTLEASVEQARRLAAACGGEGARLLGIDGALVPPWASALDRPGAWWRFVAASPRASAHVGLRWLETMQGPDPTGWMIDCGSTSTEASWIERGVVEPRALHDPAAFAMERLEAERLVWVGALATPVDTLMRHVTVLGRTLPVFPRMGTTESALTWLGALDADLVREVTGRPSLARERAGHELAQTVGLDPVILGEEGLDEIARAVVRAARARIAGAPWQARGGEQVWVGLGAIAGLPPGRDEAGVRPGAEHHRVSLEARLSALAVPLGLAWMGLEEMAGPVHFDDVVGEGTGPAGGNQSIPHNSGSKGSWPETIMSAMKSGQPMISRRSLVENISGVSSMGSSHSMNGSGNAELSPG